MPRGKKEGQENRGKKQACGEGVFRVVYGILPDMNWLTANCMSDELHDEAMSCIRVDSSVEIRSTFLASQLLAGSACFELASLSSR